MATFTRSEVKEKAKSELKINFGAYLITVILLYVGSALPLIGTICFPVLTYGGIVSIRNIREIGNFEFDDLIAGFKNNFGNIMAAGWMKMLYVFLGTLLCFIPGIYFSYVYYWTDYIIADNPEMNYNEVLALSKAMTEGHKMDLFVFDLSWLGWALLTGISCGLAAIYVAPYSSISRLELYEAYRDEYQA